MATFCSSFYTPFCAFSLSKLTTKRVSRRWNFSLNDGVAATPGTKGDYTWNGANGTQFWADPKERLVVVVGTAAPGEIRKYYREQVGALVYGAMTELRR